MNLQEFTKRIVTLNRAGGVTDEQIMSKQWLGSFADNVAMDVEGEYPIEELEMAILKVLQENIK